MNTHSVGRGKGQKWCVRAIPDNSDRNATVLNQVLQRPVVCSDSMLNGLGLREDVLLQSAGDWGVIEMQSDE